MCDNRNTEENIQNMERGTKKKKKKKEKKQEKKQEEKGKNIRVWSVLGSFGSFNTKTKNLHKKISLL
jgi:muconolactone delta-isomerase